MLTDLGDLPGGDEFAFALGNNDLGQVVGLSNTATGFRGFLFESGIMTDIGDLPGGDNESFAVDINNLGQVTGRSEGKNGTRAFLWGKGVMRDLGELPGGLDDSVGIAINDSGQVVGRSETAAGPRVFLWENGVMYDLNDLIDPSDPLRESFELAYVRDINKSGQIVGYPSDLRAFLATPVGNETAQMTTVSTLPVWAYSILMIAMSFIACCRIRPT